jgi:hypothetical protein
VGNDLPSERVRISTLRRYTAYENDIIRLQAELRSAETLTTKAQQRRSYKQLIQEVGDYWDEVVRQKDICWNDYILMQEYGISKKEFKNGTFRQLFCTFVGPGDHLVSKPHNLIDVPSLIDYLQQILSRRKEPADATEVR